MRPLSLARSRFLHLPSPSFFRAALAACLFLLVLSAKWATFERYGSPMPDWDQWDAEAVETLLPWFQQDNFLQHLFHPHNEHRVILTKLQNLALVLLNGQWDARLEAVTNAALHAALAAALWLVSFRLLFSPPPPFSASPRLPVSSSPRLAPFAASLLFLLILAFFALPVAWQNVLGGFHSQQYWLLLLSFAAIVTLPYARRFSAAWWLGAVSGFLALGSMASGFLAAAVVLAVLAFRLLRRETTLRETWPTVALGLLLVVAGLAARHEVPWHAGMKARSAADFARSFLHSMQWPWRERHWAAPLVWLPWFLLSFHLARSLFTPPLRSPRTSSTTPLHSLTPPLSHSLTPFLLPFSLGLWVLLQLLATAYARGAGADYPASRYMDTLSIGVLANAFALVCLLTLPATAPRSLIPSSPRLPRSAIRPFVLPLFALAWLFTVAFGLRHLLRDIVQWELADAKKYYVAAESNVRCYLATADPRHLARKDVPYPDPAGLAERLTHPVLRPLLPVPLRPPLALAPAPDASGLFRNDATGADIDVVNPPRAGLSPTTPPLDFTPTWGSFGAGHDTLWRSTPLEPTRFAFLKFEVAGDISPSVGNVVLELRDARTDQLLTLVRPSRPPGHAWRSAYVRMPRVPFIVVAHDRSPDRWLAFSAPAEMATLSYYAWQATRHGLLTFWIASGLTVAVAAVALVCHLRAARLPAVSPAPAGLA